MKRDMVDDLLQQWANERPGMDASALGVVVRIQLLGKLLGSRANLALKQHDLKHWEYDVLSVLRRQGEPFAMPATDIARAAQLTSGAMTTRIDGLEQRKLVRRKQSKNDGRSVIVKLSAKGRRLIDRAMQTRFDDALAVMQNFKPKEQHKLAEQLRSLLLDHQD